MGRSQETYNKKEVRSKKEKKKKDKEAKRLARKETEKKGSLDDMLAYVDEFGNIVDAPPDPSQKEEIDVENITLGATKREPAEEMDPIRKGRVTFFNESKGFGFIEDLETQESVFVHINNVQDEIAENDRVTYEVEMGQKGPMAVRVKQTA